MDENEYCSEAYWESLLLTEPQQRTPVKSALLEEEEGKECEERE